MYILCWSLGLGKIKLINLTIILKKIYLNLKNKQLDVFLNWKSFCSNSEHTYKDWLFLHLHHLLYLHRRFQNCTFSHLTIVVVTLIDHCSNISSGSLVIYISYQGPLIVPKPRPRQILQDFSKTKLEWVRDSHESATPILNLYIDYWKEKRPVERWRWPSSSWPDRRTWCPVRRWGSAPTAARRNGTACAPWWTYCNKELVGWESGRRQCTAGPGLLTRCRSLPRCRSSCPAGCGNSAPWRWACRWCTWSSRRGTRSRPTTRSAAVPARWSSPAGSTRVTSSALLPQHGWAAVRTWILDCTVMSVNMVCMSMSACRTSRYTDPRKPSGIDSWNSSPFTITRSPTVMWPGDGRRAVTDVLYFQKFTSKSRSYSNVRLVFETNI